MSLLTHRIVCSATEAMLALSVMNLIDSPKKFQKWSYFLLYYTLLVVLWGAWVRISHSGDGCGDTWPLCQGQLVPQAQQGKTWVELSHRLTSGLFGLLVVFLYLRARKIFSIDHPARSWAFWTLIFTITEALLGAKLVLFGLVGSDSSAFRMFAMILHLINSLTLVACITLLGATSISEHLKLQFRQNKAAFRIAKIYGIAFMVLASSGAIAALSTTLFPSNSLLLGLQTDFSAESHWILKLRITHPILGLILGGSLVLGLWLGMQSGYRISAALRSRSMQLLGFLAANVSFGFLTLLSLSPIWMKLGHLLLGYLTWIALVRWLIELKSISLSDKA